MALELHVWAGPGVPFANEEDEMQFLTDVALLARRHGWKINYEVAEVPDEPECGHNNEQMGEDGLLRCGDCGKVWDGIAWRQV